MKNDNVNTPSARDHYQTPAVEASDQHPEETIQDLIHSLNIVFHDCARPTAAITPEGVRLTWQGKTRKGRTTLTATGNLPLQRYNSERYITVIQHSNRRNNKNLPATDQLGSLTLEELRPHILDTTNGYNPQQWHPTTFRRDAGPWTAVVAPGLNPSHMICQISHHGLPVLQRHIYHSRWKDAVSEAESILKQCITDHRTQQKAIGIGMNTLARRRRTETQMKRRLGDATSPATLNAELHNLQAQHAPRTTIRELQTIAYRLGMRLDRQLNEFIAA